VSVVLLNVAVTVFTPVIVTLQVLPAKLLQPVQVTVYPGEGLAESVIDDPTMKFAVHDGSQVMPAGTLETLLELAPGPAFVTVRG
jgi:hypothetical protein